MPYTINNSKSRSDIKPDNTLYGPKSVAVKIKAAQLSAQQVFFGHDLGSIRSKIFLLILILPFASFIGFCILMVNSLRIQDIAGDFSENFSESLAAILLINMIAAVVVFLVMLGIIFFILTFLSRRVFTPVNEASLAFKALARGDLSQNLTVEGNDEIAMMIKTLSQTQERVKSLIKTIDGKTQSLSRVGIEMQNMMNDSAEMVNRISANTGNMKAKSASQLEGVSKTSMAMNQIIGSIKSLDTNIEQQADSVSRSSAAIEEMISNIASITVNLARNEEDLMRLRVASADGNSSLQKVSGDIQEVAKESERLLEINKVIQNIASQTNLLAMNAAIEAAHAGDVGRGFAVVADEIRKLAESSSQQAKTVSAVLKNINKALGNISSSTVASLKQFYDIDKGFETVSAQSLEIRNSMEQQDAGNKEVLAAIGSSNEVARKVRGSSSEIQSTSQELARESKNLEGLSGELTSVVGEIVLGIESINAALTRASEISSRNREDVDKLLREIGKFSV
jgi:methyl-accepting chemotaxis protein